MGQICFLGMFYFVRADFADEFRHLFEQDFHRAWLRMFLDRERAIWLQNVTFHSEQINATNGRGFTHIPQAP